MMLRFSGVQVAPSGYKLGRQITEKVYTGKTKEILIKSYYYYREHEKPFSWA